MVYDSGSNDQGDGGGEAAAGRIEKYPRETYNDVIDRLTPDALEEEAEELTDEDIRDIEEAVRDIKAGRVYTTEELKRELGID